MFDSWFYKDKERCLLLSRLHTRLSPSKTQRNRMGSIISGLPPTITDCNGELILFITHSVWISVFIYIRNRVDLWSLHRTCSDFYFVSSKAKRTTFLGSRVHSYQLNLLKTWFGKTLYSFIYGTEQIHDHYIDPVVIFFSFVSPESNLFWKTIFLIVRLQHSQNWVLLMINVLYWRNYPWTFSFCPSRKTVRCTNHMFWAGFTLNEV